MVFRASARRNALPRKAASTAFSPSRDARWFSLERKGLRPSCSSGLATLRKPRRLRFRIPVVNSKKIRPPLRADGLFLLAEKGGFEPPIPETGIPDFESGAFDHSATSPGLGWSNPSSSVRFPLGKRTSGFFTYGAPSGNRTRTPLPEKDFESFASTNSAIRARFPLPFGKERGEVNKKRSKVKTIGL